MFSSKSQVERRIVGAFWNDGLVDILCGVAVFLIGIAWHFDLVPLGAIAPALAVPLWKSLRERITQPRLGHVEFSDTQTTRYREFLAWSFLIGCSAFIVATSVYFYVADSGRAIPIERWVAAIPAWILAFLAMLTSLVILVRRFIGYAGVFSLLGLLVAVFDQTPDIPMLVGGATMTIVGSIRLRTFIHSHPLEMNGS